MLPVHEPSNSYYLKHSNYPQANNPASKKWCEVHECWYGEDNCNCGDEVVSDSRGKSFGEVLKEKKGE